MSATRGIEPRAVNSGNATQGMLSPANPFVMPDDTLTPVSFRFLWGLMQAVQALESRVTTIEQRLAAANIP